MYSPIANPNHPRLRIGKPFIETPRRCHRIHGQLKGSGLNIDRHNFPMISLLNLRPNLGLIEFIAPSGEFFFAITGRSNCHRFDLYSLFASRWVSFSRKQAS
jgi:hypothetical protein